MHDFVVSVHDLVVFVHDLVVFVHNLVVFVHNFYTSQNLSDKTACRHCHICYFIHCTVTHGSKTYECTFVYDSILWTCRWYTVLIIYFYTQVCFLVLLPSLLTQCTVMDHFKFHTCVLSASQHVLTASYRTRNPLKHRANYVGYVAIRPTAT